jgi:hypothetical protein
MEFKSPAILNDVIGQCNNPNCKAPCRRLDAEEQISRNGMAIAFCDNTVFQVIKCNRPECRGRIVFRSDISSPILDMRGLILVPDNNADWNAAEQCWILQNQNSWHDFLNFSLVQAWDESHLSEDKFKTDYSGSILCDPKQLSKTSVPIIMSESDFYARLDQEKIAGQIKLRRLLPDNPKLQSLLTCLAPLKFRETYYGGGGHADGLSNEDLTIRRATWKKLIETATGQSLEEAITEKLESKGIKPPSPSDLFNLVNRELFYKASASREQLWAIVSEKGFNEQLDTFFQKVFRSIFYPVCTELALKPKREELLSWPDKVEHGKSLFVDAPMGLGKTYSIVEALASNPDLSAVIFMPTNKLCKEIIENLKTKIAAEKKLDYGEIQNQRIPVKDDDGNQIFDEDGLPQENFNLNFLEDEVYFADGINPNECPYTDEIISKYQKNWIKKRLVCNHCEKNSTCRFLHHKENAIEARIVVTTHHQYDHFYQSNELHSWEKDGDRNQRDLFIIDEDIVFSQLYQPINLDYDELKAFVGTITDFLQRYDEIANLRHGIDCLFSHVNKCDSTSIIRPIDPDFSFPETFIKEWERSLPEQPFIIPEYIKWDGVVGNHLKVIEHAVRLGAVVEKWGKKFKIHLPNPRSYDLSKAPPHVFFDGTMLNERFLNNKLNGVEFEKWTIDIDPLWEVRIFQNTNSDLPETRIKDNLLIVQQFLMDIIKNTPVDKKIFLVTTNAIAKTYLNEFIDLNLQDRGKVSGYFGNLRGINDAQKCDLGIMLGSFMPSDSVEIAMALELINHDHLEKDITTTINNLWTWRDTNGVRKYRDDFAIIGQMAQAYRHSEHRQALARTRYLFHDVDFFIVSKDLVSDYDPFLRNTVDDHFREDLFPPRPKRPEALQKFDEVAEKVFEWLKTHDTVIAAEITKNYGKRGGTVGKKLKEMRENGLLVLDGSKKTTYRLPPMN